MKIPFKTLDYAYDVDIVDHVPYLKTNDIEILDEKVFTEDGNYWGIQRAVENLYKATFSNKELDLKPGNTIYFDKGCKVSREKLKGLLERTNCKVIRDHSKADIVITSLSSFESVFKRTKYNKYNTLNYVRPFTHDKRFNQGIIMEGNAAEKISDLIKNHYPSLLGKRNSWSNIKTWYDMGSVNVVLKSDIMSSITMLYHESKGNVYDESAILKLMGETIIDLDGYKSMCSMMESSDKGNHNIVMTIMANCNYERSIGYIMMLLFNYGYKMWDNPLRNSVAFKGVVSYVGLNAYKLNYNYGNVLKVCCEKGILTQDMIDIIYAEGLDQISYDDDYLTITSYDFNPEVKQKLYSRLENDNRLSSGGEVLQQEVQLQL